MTAPGATCTRCGTPVPAGERVCRQCGADISGQQGQVATAYVAASETPLLDALRRATLGEYDVKGELGRGGMASVFAAHDIALDRKVAIKVMSPALFSTAGMVERFKREARTAASLSHPNIIPIYAVRESPEIVYFVMKYVDGRSLESIVRQLGQMPIPLVQAILYQVGAALGYAHRRGVVHRDVKPANIMIDADGWPIVTDFGIAKVAEKEGLTQTGATIGTPSYMSPEQCAAKRDLTGASDQYSLGIVAYEMLGGALPFHAETTIGLLFAHVHETPEPITELRPDCPPAVAAAVMRMLEKEPEERWPDIEAAVTALGGVPIGHDDPIRAQLVELAGGHAQNPAETIRTPISPIPRNRAAPPPSTRTSAPKDRRPATRTGTAPPQVRPAAPAVTRRRSPLLWVLAPVVLLGAGAAWWFLGQGEAPQPAPASPVAAVETVRVPETAPAETVHVTDTQRLASPVVPSTSTPMRQPAPTGPRAGSEAATAFSMAESRALPRRFRAVSAGATKAELAPGDRELQAADALAQQGHYREADIRLAAAAESWNAAWRAAQGRPRPSGGGLQEEMHQVALEFAAAFNSGNLLRVRSVYPDIPSDQAEQWQALFLNSRNIALQLTVSNVARNGPGQVQASFDGFYDYTENRTSTPRRQAVSWQATLRQSPRGWRIVALR
jgi:serine/threonine protein kinase